MRAPTSADWLIRGGLAIGVASVLIAVVALVAPQWLGLSPRPSVSGGDITGSVSPPRLRPTLP
ncbi:MAG TPA: hypothetical protein VMP03_01190 [Methylomirabilota bacterium]|nr:hypothetical protein [Methylomirabilota bacterium]